MMAIENTGLAPEWQLTRRKFVLGGLGALLLPVAGIASAPDIRLLSPATRDGRHFATALQPGSMERQTAPLPMRGHGLLLDPRNPKQALIIARRPGTQAIKVDLSDGSVVGQWEANMDRHFFGHACYSADGRTVFTTESNIDTGEGIVSMRAADDFRVLAEYPSHGIGPHELILLEDGVTLAVANGGVLTLPETGRVKLNRGRIESSLVYLDSRNGRLVGKHRLPSSQLSLRHLALAPNGMIAAALQFEGDRETSGVPVMAFHSKDGALRLADAPPDDWDRMQQYAASVAYDPVTDRFALSCPKGDVIGCWSAAGNYLGLIDVPKASGIAFGMGQGFASNELGDLYRLDLARLDAVRHTGIPALQWDNHLYIAPV